MESFTILNENEYRKREANEGWEKQERQLNFEKN